MSYKLKVEAYSKISGRYIQACSQLELVITTFILFHYFENNSSKKNEFIEHFLTKQGITFQTLITIFGDIIGKHHKKFKSNNSEILSKKKLNEIVHYRNIFAHSCYAANKINHNLKEDEIRLLWTSKADILDKLKIDSNYGFNISYRDSVIKYESLMDCIEIIISYSKELKKGFTEEITISDYEKNLNIVRDMMKVLSNIAMESGIQNKRG